MKCGLLVVALTGLALTAGGVREARAQQGQEEGGDQQALVQKWLEFMTPGAEHELLKQKVGKWTVKMEMRVAPDAEVTVSEGTAEMKMIMDGRYLMGTSKSDFQGQPFEGQSFTGYDNLKKRFVTIWIDNLGTGFTISSGTYDKDTRTFNYVTMSPDVELGDYKRTTTKERRVDEDEWVLEMYDTTADGKEFLMMKAVYTRDKS